MKLRSIIILGLLMTFTASVMANGVVIYNKSKHPIPIKYQFAYHNPNQPVVLMKVAQSVVYGHSSIYVDIPTQTSFKHSGIIMLAVKKALPGDWLYLPEYAKEFDGNPGCWMRTSKSHPEGNIFLSYHKDTRKHGRITCSAYLNAS